MAKVRKTTRMVKHSLLYQGQSDNNPSKRVRRGMNSDDDNEDDDDDSGDGTPDKDCPGQNDGMLSSILDDVSISSSSGSTEDSNDSDEEDSDGIEDDDSGKGAAKQRQRNVMGPGKVMKTVSKYPLDSSSDDSDEEDVPSEGLLPPIQPLHKHGGKVFPIKDGADEEERSKEDEVSGSVGGISVEEKETESDKETQPAVDCMFQNLSTKAVTINLCQLHHCVNVNSTSIPNTSIPNTQACTFNGRGFNQSRITCIDQNDNMLCKLRKDEKNFVPSVIDERVVVVFSSFCDGKPLTNSLPMTDVKSPHEKNIIHYAVPLTLEIVEKAVVWLKGRAWKDTFQDDEEAMKNEVEKIITETQIVSTENVEGLAVEKALTVY